MRRYISVSNVTDGGTDFFLAVSTISKLDLGPTQSFAQRVLKTVSKKLKIKIYRTIMLPVVLYGCETWLLTLREEHRLRVFENRVLRRVFGPKRDEVTGEWREIT